MNGRHQVNVVFSFALITAVASWIFSAVNFSILSYDSYRLIEIGLDIGWAGTLSHSAASKLAAWGVFLPSIHAIGAITGIDYLYGFQALFVVSFAATWFYFLWIEYNQRSNFGLKFLYVGLATLSLFTTYFFVFQAGYIHNSMIAAGYLFFLVAASKLELDGKLSASTVYLIALFFALCRAEGPVAVLLVFAVWHAHKDILSRDVWFYFLIFACPIILWYCFLLMYMGKSGDILTPDRVFIILSILVIYGLGMLLTLFSEICNTVFKWFGQHILLVLIACSLVIIAFKFENTIDSVAATARNMIDTGRWGYFWLCTMVALTLCVCKTYKSRLNLFLIVGIASTLFIIDISFTRIPYRLGFGDSGNRMLTHVAPLLWFYVMAVFSSNMIKSEKTQ